MSRVSSGMLYLIEFLHQTTTIYEDVRLDHMLYLIEFLHQTTTLLVSFPLTLLLYLIEFLHQTTTLFRSSPTRRELYLIEFLHQTTTSIVCAPSSGSCILLNFYIKQQRRGRYLFDFSALCRFVRPGNRMRNLRRSEFDVLFCISKNKDTVF